jgi:hypothetical protein
MSGKMVDVFGTVTVNTEQSGEVPFLWIEWDDKRIQARSRVRNCEIRSGRRFSDATRFRVRGVCQHDA